MVRSESVLAQLFRDLKFKWEAQAFETLQNHKYRKIDPEFNKSRAYQIYVYWESAGPTEDFPRRSILKDFPAHLDLDLRSIEI